MAAKSGPPRTPRRPTWTRRRPPLPPPPPAAGGFPPEPIITAIDAFNRAALATGGTKAARYGAWADYNGHRYDVIRTIRGYATGYTWSGWNVTERGTFAECVEAAARGARRPEKGSSAWCAVNASEPLTEEQIGILLSHGFEPCTDEARDAWEAKLPWQARTEPASPHTRVGFAFYAVRMEREEGVPASLFFEAASNEDWRAKVADWKRAERERRAW